MLRSVKRRKKDEFLILIKISEINSFKRAEWRDVYFVRSFSWVYRFSLRLMSFARLKRIFTSSLIRKKIMGTEKAAIFKCEFGLKDLLSLRWPKVSSVIWIFPSKFSSRKVFARQKTVIFPCGGWTNMIEKFLGKVTKRNLFCHHQYLRYKRKEIVKNFYSSVKKITRLKQLVFSLKHI